MVFKLLVSPDRFFAERAESPSLIAPMAVVATAGLATTLGTVYALVVIGGRVGGGTGSFLTLGGLISALGGFLTVFVLWFLVSGAFYAVSGVYGGEGEFRQTFLLTGWGFLPQILSGVASTVAMMIAIRESTVPAELEQLQTFTATLQTHPAFTGAELLGLVFTVWSGFLWAFAVRHSRSISLRNAGLTVLLPVAVLVAISLNSIL